MPRNRIMVIYALLGVFALSAGLLVAKVFGSSVTLPSGYAAPSAPAAQATAPPASTAASVPAVAGAPTAPPSSVPEKAPTAAPTDTPLPPSAPPTDTPLPPSAPPTDTPLPPTATAPSDYVDYTVQKGDILKLIAQKYGVTVADILAVNQIANPDSLNVGSVIHIPKQ
jgi:LysM repeat protein